MLTLNDIKEALRIDYEGIDDTLQSWLDGEIIRAEKATGVKEACFNSDIHNGIKKGVEYQFSGDENARDTSIIIYRRNCKRPMF